ncbi:ribosomal protein L6 [Clavulina sp. PMI_390]|nr:ribosomal protein L6 [Clavulina sp. PMI_390]
MQRSFVRAFSSSARAASHVGSTPIAYPESVSFAQGNGILTVKGPKGSTNVPLAPFVNFTSRPHAPKISPDAASSSTTPPPHPNELVITVEDPTVKQQRATWGLSRSLIANAVTGLTDGFAIPLRLVGVGYRAWMDKDPQPAPGMTGQRIALKLGYAHEVYVPIPEGITAATPIPTKIVLRGTDKQQIGQLAAQIRAWRKPEPYKGKGVFVGNETIKLKDVKKK